MITDRTGVATLNKNIYYMMKPHESLKLLIAHDANNTILIHNAQSAIQNLGWAEKQPSLCIYIFAASIFIPRFN